MNTTIREPRKGNLAMCIGRKEIMDFVWLPAVSTGLSLQDQYQEYLWPVCFKCLECLEWVMCNGIEITLRWINLWGYGWSVHTEAFRLFQGRLDISNKIGEILGRIKGVR